MLRALHCVHMKLTIRRQTSLTTDALNSHEKQFSMSLRRSARVANTSATVPITNRVTNGVAKYTKVEKPAAAQRKRKSSATKATPQDDYVAPTEKPEFTVPDLPATPLPKKRRGVTVSGSPSNPPPLTPTPSGVGLIATSTSSGSGHPLEILASLKPRPAEPHATNAPLSTPGGSHVVAYHSSPVKPEDPSPVKRRKAKEVVPPDVGTIKPPSTNIDTLLKEAEEFLISVDPKLGGLIEKHHCKMFSPEGLREVVDPFTALASSIMGQQVRIEWEKAAIQDEGKDKADEAITGLGPSGCINSQEVYRALRGHAPIISLPSTSHYKRLTHSPHCRPISTQSRVHLGSSREIRQWRANRGDARKCKRRRAD
jgi:hypothetical protein